MSRWFTAKWPILAAFAAAAIAQQTQQTAEQKPPAQTPAANDQVQLPPEEDKQALAKEYSFNPLQSQKEVTVGEFYFKKGDFHAAAGRFREATKWNDGNAHAWLRLGETEEKDHDAKSAGEAYEKYLKLAPDAKNAPDVKKRLAKIKR